MIRPENPFIIYHWQEGFIHPVMEDLCMLWSGATTAIRLGRNDDVCRCHLFIRQTLLHLISQNISQTNSPKTKRLSKGLLGIRV